MSDVIKTVKDWFIETTKEALEDGKELLEKGKKHTEIFKLKKKMHSMIFDLGALVYKKLKSRSKSEIRSDEKIKELFKEIKNIEKQIKELKEDV